MVPSLPPAKEPLDDKGYDSNRLRQALINRGIAPCSPSSLRHKLPLSYDKALYPQRHRIEDMWPSERVLPYRYAL